MKSMNAEIKKVVNRVKDAQGQLQNLVKSHDWVEEARKYAERQSKEVKKLFAPDVEKMKLFLERERKELERFQKQIPAEVKKIRQFVNSQKKEFEKLLSSVRKMNPKTGGSRQKGSKRPRKAEPSHGSPQRKVARSKSSQTPSQSSSSSDPKTST